MAHQLLCISPVRNNENNQTECRDLSTGRNKPLPNLTPNQIDRFRSCYTEGDKDACWEWAGTIHKGSGRPVFKIGDAQWYAYRLAYYIVTGVDPGQLLVCHTCDNPPCVNPSHLFRGTDDDNQHDKVVKERHLKTDRTSANASLTADQVVAIRASTNPYLVLAEKYGVSDPLISLIKQGKIYTHVGGPLNVISDMGEQYAHKLKGNEATIRAIRVATGPLRAIARDHGMTHKAVSNIKRGVTYQFIPWTQDELTAVDAYFKGCKPGRQKKAS